MSTPPFVDVILNGKNYKEWSVTIRMVLLGWGLIEHIDNTSLPPTTSMPIWGANTSDSSIAQSAIWYAADHRAMAFISLSVEIDIRLSIAHLPTAQKMWDHLLCMFEEPDRKQLYEVQSLSSSMDPRLLGAVRSGDVALLQQLCAEDANLLKSSTPHGNTALHLAVIFRQDEFAKDLCLKCPSLLSAANGDGNTPLLLAAALGIQPIVDFVIVLPASPSSPTGDVEEGKTEDLELPREKNNLESPPPVKSRHKRSMADEVDSLMRSPTNKYEGPSGNRGLPAGVKLGHPAATPSEAVEEGNQKLKVTNKMGNNALHEALRNGHGEVALVLLRAEPELARQVNNNGESPLYMACYRSLEVVVEELLRWSTASHEGPNGETALHAAVMVGHSGLVKALLKERPSLGRAAAKNGGTPLHYASRFNKLAVAKLLLESDASLAYVVDKDGYQPITLAVIRGYVRIVEEIVRRFPDSALMASSNGNTPLHIAVDNGSVEVVKYILRTPELQVLINQPNCDGEVPLHIAVRECNKETLRALLACKSLDKEAVNNQGQTAVDVFFSHPEFTLRRVSTRKMLISAFPKHHRLARGRRPTLEKKIQNPKGDGTMESLFRSYANNSIVVATLMATITFAAAFTVPGGYDGNQDANQGLPILARKAAFKAFLISDTIALCASLAVAFLCIFAPWVDDDFLVRYVDSTRRLLFCGFAAMSVAFATGLYAVVAPGSLWLAAVICVLCCSLPLVTFLTGEWTVYGGRLKLLMSSNLKKIKEKIFQENGERTKQ